MVRTFSTKFPSNHSLKGEQTFFIEKILNSLSVNYQIIIYYEKLIKLNQKNIDLGKLTVEDIESFWIGLKDISHLTIRSKHHTVRGGNHLKVGDKFSPRIWFGKPYNSPQIIFWDDLEVLKTYDFEIVGGSITINQNKVDSSTLIKLANNDGLITDELLDWFQWPKTFIGQIICWSDEVDY